MVFQKYKKYEPSTRFGGGTGGFKKPGSTSTSGPNDDIVGGNR